MVRNYGSCCGRGLRRLRDRIFARQQRVAVRFHRIVSFGVSVRARCAESNMAGRLIGACGVSILIEVLSGFSGGGFGALVGAVDAGLDG